MGLHTHWGFVHRTGEGGVKDVSVCRHCGMKVSLLFDGWPNKYTKGDSGWRHTREDQSFFTRCMYDKDAPIAEPVPDGTLYVGDES